MTTKCWVSHCPSRIILHSLAFAGLLIRLSVVLFSDNVHHPDEIFQYLEQAHRIVFGYGYIPWEYRFETRSWIVPGFISTILLGFKSLGIDRPTLYIFFIKFVLCCLSTSLIYSTYYSAKNLASDYAGLLAATFTCFWYELVYFAHKPNPEVLATYLFIAALACAVATPSRAHPFLLGFFCAMSVALRLQYIIPVGLLLMYVFLKWKRNLLFKTTLIFCLFIGFAGLVDYLTWGKFFISYYNNYVFNRSYNIASLFGTQPLLYYFFTLTVSSLCIFPIIGLLGIIFYRHTWLIIILILSIILSHSSIPHKEHRFVFLALPLFFILLSIILTRITVLFGWMRLKMNTLIVIGIFIIVSLAGLFNQLPYQQFMYGRHPLLESDDNLKAYLYLFDQPGLYAVLNISKPWWETGGYYYLHRDVPIYRKEHFDLKHSKDYVDFISHIICLRDYPTIAGFHTIWKTKSIEIRKRTANSPVYKNHLFDTRIVLQPGIDDKFNLH